MPREGGRGAKGSVPRERTRSGGGGRSAARVGEPHMQREELAARGASRAMGRAARVDTQRGGRVARERKGRAGNMLRRELVARGGGPRGQASGERSVRQGARRGRAAQGGELRNGVGCASGRAAGRPCRASGEQTRVPRVGSARERG